MDAIRIESLTKRYKDVTAVDRLSLCIRDGELLSLLGVNGAGKTTTIHMLCCLTAPTDGDAFIHRHSIVRDSVGVRSVIAVSPQETAVAPGLTVKENLQLMGGAYGLSKTVCRERLTALCDLLGLQEILSKKAGKLSGGWQRRLSIAMALLCEPKVLFLDEPTLGLDVIARSELWDILRSLKGKITIVLTTHYMEEAKALSDRVAIMKNGRLLTCKTVDEICADTGTDDFEEAFIRTVKGATS